MVILLKLAISGRDGIGKTQQVQLLSLGNAKTTHRLKGLAEYNDEWPALSETAFHEWWFNQVNFDDLARIIIEALNNRNMSCIPEKINILDRGTAMFKAVLAATYLAKNLGGVEDAYDRVDALFARLLEFTPNEHDLLLIPNSAYERKIKPLVEIVDNRTNKYTPEQLARYATYQKHLSHTIDHYYLQVPLKQRVVVNGCIVDIQNKVRVRVNGALSSGLPMVCENFEQGIALGGLSESGKSSFGDMLSRQHGFYRLKLRYFEDILIRAEHTTSTGNMGFELASFLNCHPHITRASVESIHDPILPAYFKLLFGDRFKLVFLSVQEELRISRATAKTGISVEEALTELREKDQIKRSRGAHRVEDIADIVFDNTTDGLETATERFAKELGL